MRRAHKRRAGEVKNARFWTRWNGGWVRVSLRPGDTFILQRSEPTEEGYSFEYEEYTHEEDRILLRWESGGRDCDGTHTTGGKSAVALDKLAVRRHEPVRHESDLRDGSTSPAGLMLPDWKEVGHARVYDQYAQMSGY